MTLNEPVGIDYTPAAEQGGGIGRYVRELVQALATQDQSTPYRLFVAGQWELPASPGPNFTWHKARLSPKWFARVWHRLRIPIPVNRWVGDVAIYHATDFTLPPVASSTRTILTVHDLSFIHTPETAEPSLRAYLNRVVPHSVERADLILADSESTRADVIDAYNVDPLRIHTLYCGVEDTFQSISDNQRLQAIRNKYRIGDRPFIFSVGTVQPRKNYARLAEALHQLGYEGIKLVIAGGKGWLEDELYSTIERLGMQDQVQFLGFVPDEDLPLLYNAARVFAFPSLYEGFGLPPLEAMACGVPVVTSAVSSLPEVVGEAALLVDPYEVDAIADALRQAIEDEALRKTMITRGQIRSQAFSWQSAAQQLRRHYESLLS